MAVEFPFPFELFLIVPALFGMVLLTARFAPRIVSTRRQAAYERVIFTELDRLEIAVPANQRLDPDTPVELIRALHPRQRRGVDRWAVGWPPFEVRVVARDGALVWQVDAPHQLSHQLMAAVRSVYPGSEIAKVERVDTEATATAVGSLTAPGHWPLGDPSEPGRALVQLAALLEQSPLDHGEVRLRLLAKPIAPESWQRALYPEEQRGRSFGSIAGEALLDAIFNRPSSMGHDVPVVLSAAERQARSRKRVAQVGFEVGMLLEVAGLDVAEAKALLWQLIDFADAVGDGRQAIAWTIRPGAVERPRRAPLGDWELAKLWRLPDAAFDDAHLRRQRPMIGPAPASAPRGGLITIGETRQGALQLSVEQLARHMLVVGATGAGKSTMLVDLALGVLDTPIGATVIDPHGDLATDILSRVPAQHADRVRVLRLADKAYPRGFNFLERADLDEAQLVASEFVALFEDLWPKFCGPKMAHYLRKSLLTMLSHPEPQTVIELVRLLTDDDLRENEYMRYVADDPLLFDFWRNEWPSRSAREHDSSIKAVLNKLGAFVSYHSIRHVVGQGVSSLRPRDVMDRGDLLVVDLSRVGGDNASLFGAMLIGRYYIDAVGRQGTALAERRQHLLIVDEAQRFSTRAMDKILVEGRKFALAGVLATQSLNGADRRLHDTIVTNVATMALLSPGADDARELARLFTPLGESDLLALQRHEFALRMPGADDRPAVYGGRVRLPATGDAARAAALVAASDRRDGRPLDTVRGEVHRRAGGDRDDRPPNAVSDDRAR
jgi:hypothetical protein